jgi:hypothetical protein
MLRIVNNRNTSVTSITAPAGVTELGQQITSGDKYSIAVGLDDAVYDSGSSAPSVQWATQCGSLDGFGGTFALKTGPVLADGGSGVTRYVNVGLFKIDSHGQVNISGTSKSLLSIGYDHRVIPDARNPNSIGYPTVKRYLELEAQDDRSVIHMDQTAIVTRG